MEIKITKTTLTLCAIVLLGFILRLIVATHAHIGPDEMVYSTIPLNIIAAARLSTVEQSPLYFYLQDSAYKLFGGITPLSTRITSVVFGSFAIVLIYILTNELFRNKRAALSAAFLFAVSGYTLRYNYETDMTAFFFGLLSVLFFYRGLHGDKYGYPASALFLGLGALAKNIVFLFLPAYVLIFIFQYTNDVSKTVSEYKINRKVIIQLGCAALILLIVVFPVGVYNYMLKNEKGISDYYFSNILGYGETVHKGFTNPEWSISLMGQVLKKKIPQFLWFDGLIALSGIFGIVASFRKNRYGTGLLLLTVLSFGGYMAGVTASNSHYIWVMIVLSILGGHGVSTIAEKGYGTVSGRSILLVALTLIFIVNMVMLRDVLLYKSSILSLREYVHDNIPEDSLVVIDPQVYRGIHAWVFNDRHYIEGTQWPKLTEIIQQTKTGISTPLYYIECGKETTCLWSTEDTARIKEFSTQLSDGFHKIAKQVATIRGEDTEPGNQHVFHMYRTDINAPADLLEAVDKTHIFYFYPVGWKYPEQAVDSYVTEGSILHKLGLLVLYFNVLIALGALPFTIYLLMKSNEGDNHEHRENNGQ